MPTGRPSLDRLSSRSVKTTRNVPEPVLYLTGTLPSCGFPYFPDSSVLSMNQFKDASLIGCLSWMWT